MDSQPLVSCLCLTRNRREWLPKALECFLRQDYPNRELIIVPDMPEDLIELPRDERIRVLPPIYHHQVVGTKRNRGCAAGTGDLIALWDDDDYSSPARLTHQVRELLAAGLSVHGFHSMKFTDGRRWWRYSGASSFVLGTSLTFKRSWWQKHPFRDVQCGQDEQFAQIANASGELVSEPDAGFMYATIHPKNTARRRVTTGNWKELPGFAWSEPNQNAEVA